jgi:hypothetical protein
MQCITAAVPAGYPQLDCAAAAYGVVMSNEALMDWARRYKWLDPVAMFTGKMDEQDKTEMHTALSAYSVIPVVGVLPGAVNALLYLSEGDLWCAAENGLFAYMSFASLGTSNALRSIPGSRLWVRKLVVAYFKDVKEALKDKVNVYTAFGSIGCGPGIAEAGIEPFLKRDDNGEHAQIAFNDPKLNPYYWWASGIYSNPVTAFHEGLSVTTKTAHFMQELRGQQIYCSPLIDLGFDFRNDDKSKRQHARILYSQMANDLFQDYMQGFTSGGRSSRAEQKYCSVMDDEQTGVVVVRDRKGSVIYDCPNVAFETEMLGIYTANGRILAYGYHIVNLVRGSVPRWYTDADLEAQGWSRRDMSSSGCCSTVWER